MSECHTIIEHQTMFSIVLLLLPRESSFEVSHLESTNRLIIGSILCINNSLVTSILFLTISDLSTLARNIYQNPRRSYVCIVVYVSWA